MFYLQLQTITAAILWDNVTENHSILRVAAAAFMTFTALITAILVEEGYKR